MCEDPVCTGREDETVGFVSVSSNSLRLFGCWSSVAIENMRKREDGLFV
jgi:hypothetical protein